MWSFGEEERGIWRRCYLIRLPANQLNGMVLEAGAGLLVAIGLVCGKALKAIECYLFIYF